MGEADGAGVGQVRASRTFFRCLDGSKANFHSQNSVCDQIAKELPLGVDCSFHRNGSALLSLGLRLKIKTNTKTSVRAIAAMTTLSGKALFMGLCLQRNRAVVTAQNTVTDGPVVVAPNRTRQLVVCTRKVAKQDTAWHG